MRLAAHASVLVLIGALSSVLASGHAEARQAPTLAPPCRVGSVLQAAIDRGQIQGAVTIMSHDGRTVWRDVRGVDDAATGKPLSEDTIFRIFSMTKPVTAVAMMILYERGLWRPSDSLAQHLPELADRKVAVGFRPDGEPILETPRRQPTVGDVMTHTAGFAYGLSDADPYERLYRRADLFGADRSAFLARLSTLPLASEPGRAWRYSVGMDIEAALIERLSGQSLSDFMKAEIFTPLGMKDTGFFVPNEASDRLAVLYAPGGDGRLTSFAGAPLGLTFDAPPVAPNGGGGLVSTAPDYMRFAQMLLNGGSLNGVWILSPRTVQLMIGGHLPERFADQDFGVGNFRYRAGMGFAYNGAVVVDPTLAGDIVGRGTYFWDGAAGTWFWIDPENNIAFVGMIQRLGAPGGPAMQDLVRPVAYQTECLTAEPTPAG